MECKNCAYFWRDNDEDYVSCHWETRCPGDMPPCEQEEYDKMMEANEEEYSSCYDDYDF